MKEYGELGLHERERGIRKKGLSHGGLSQGIT